MSLAGGCACERVRYKMASKPMFTHACHCLDCQRTTGSAFVIHSVIAKNDFFIDGQTRSTILNTGSGAGCEIHFCKNCGTFIWCKYKYHKVPVIAVRAGTLDNPMEVSPQAHLFTRSKQSWIILPTAVPSFEAAFDRNEVWPKESLKKYDGLAQAQ